MSTCAIARPETIQMSEKSRRSAAGSEDPRNGYVGGKANHRACRRPIRKLAFFENPIANGICLTEWFAGINERRITNGVIMPENHQIYRQARRMVTDIRDSKP